MIVGKPKCVWLKYVKLPDFCYGCGCLGHVLEACDVSLDDIDKTNLQYGLWLRACPMKLWRQNAELEL